MIDRKSVADEFESYTENYNLSDEKIRLKYEHTFRVASLAEDIANSLGLSSSDVDLAWLLGMLHDIGRFEQVRRYNTFIDSESVNHAVFGADLLFRERLIDNFLDGECLDREEFTIVEKAIRHHSDYRLPKDMTDREILFSNILRDADKIDILKVNCEFRLEDIYNTTTELLRNSCVTKEVMDAFFENHAVLRTLKKEPVDHVVGHISLVYELEFNRSVEIVRNQGYLNKMIHFESFNEETMKQFELIRSHMEEYLLSRCEQKR